MNATSTSQLSTLATVSPFAGFVTRTGPAQAGAVVHRVRPAAALVNPLITPAAPIVVVVKKTYTAPARVQITLRASSTVRRPATLTRIITATSGNIQLFETRSGTTPITFTPTSNPAESELVISPAELNRGKVFFAESNTPSSNIDDYKLRLTLAPGPTTGPPLEISVVAVSLTLDISPPRIDRTTPLTPLPQPPPTPAVPATDKWFGGQQINAQDPGNSQKRSQLLVEVVPIAFAGDLRLRQVRVSGNNVGPLDNKVKLFDDEIPGPLQATPIVETPKTNPFDFTITGGVISGRREFFVEGSVASTTARDTGFQLGVKNVENDGDRVAISVAVAPLISVDQSIVVVRKPHTSPNRRVITVRASTAFGRTATLTRSPVGPPIRLLDQQQPAAGTEIVVTGAGHTVSSTDLTNGIQFFAESLTPSGAANDYELTLTLAPGSPIAPPAQLRLTAVELTLDVGLLRPLPTAPPPLLSSTDKINPGRFVLVQNPAFTHERAMIILRPPNPLVPTTVRLESLNTEVQAFGFEEPSAGQSSHPRPATFPSGLLTGGMELFVEGVTASPVARTTGFRYGIDGLENECDRVQFTVLPEPSLPGPFPVGQHDYSLAAPFTVPTITENLSEQSHVDAPTIVTPATFTAFPVTLQALVRYPAVGAGVDRPVSTALATYPLVILAHGNHRPQSAPGVRVESFRGLEYLASHFASYGYIAVSIDLNDMNIGLSRDPAVVQRGLIVLEHIRQWRTFFNVLDPLFTGRVDTDRIALVGHSRGGETVVSAHRTNVNPPPHGHNIRAVVSIAPTDFLGLDLPPATPYLVIYGSEDGDVSIGWPFRLYDRATSPKAMVFVYAAIHNFFQTEPDWFTASAIDSTDPRRLLEIPHQDIAKGYCLAFLDMNVRSVGGHSHLFKRNGRPSAVPAAVELHHQIQDPTRLTIDDFGPLATLNRAAPLPPQLAARAATNSRGLPVTESALSIPTGLVNRRTQASLQHRDIAPFWHDTVGAMVAWDALGGTYTTSVGDRDVFAFAVLSFRVAQRFDSARNPNPAGPTTPGAPQDCTVRLVDSGGQVSSVRVSTIASIPFPYKRTTAVLTKSALKTIRIPLRNFTAVNGNLNLRSIRSIVFVFDVIARGEVALDDIEFSN